jgi:uncharacterized protein
MNVHEIIDRYYPVDNELKNIYMVHASKVTELALEMAGRHPELNIDSQFVEEAAMLHDIGVVLTDAPAIHCYGEHQYICHGYLGADILRSEGLDAYALVCERHTGAGISAQQIAEQGLPLPTDREYMPQSAEEKIICFADKFFSKTSPQREKSVEQAEKSLAKFGPEGVERFREWCNLFL